MKYLLVTPFTQGNHNTPNIGLAYLGTCLKNQGNEVEIIDYELKPFPINRHLKECDVLGVSVKVNTYKEAQRLTKSYHNTFPTTKIIWGGPMVTYSLDLCKSENPEVTEFYTGLATELTNCDFIDFPIPDYDLFDSCEIISNMWSSGKSRYPLTTSIGCPFACLFCNSSKQYKPRTPESCIEELNYAIKTWKIRSFMPMDDNFNLNKPRVLKFCQLVRPLRLPWTCTNGLRANTFDLEQGLALKAAGCYRFSFGIESSNPEVLKLNQKGETIDQIEKAIRIALALGFQVNGFFIIGLPGSSFELDRQSLAWAKNLGIDYHFNILTPYPGTELYDRYKDNIVGDPFKSLHFSDDISKLNVSYATKDYPIEDRIAMYKLAWVNKN